MPKIYENENFKIEISEDGKIKMHDPFGEIRYGKILPNGDLAASSSIALRYLMRARKQLGF